VEGFGSENEKYLVCFKHGNILPTSKDMQSSSD